MGLLSDPHNGKKDSGSPNEITGGVMALATAGGVRGPGAYRVYCRWYAMPST
ncbi:hypothetical protein BDV36DRAFT_262975 [Aspergillus pseudocaelatus]|uniref:Uncharacterized protein n=1 Tax=Aspergillus pseudocaelatus TaxID=1825620 RepID=A0ABQ6WE78_9EURO|nr:hypothetical protein BDV36DRAFT_262975 [Aspergillus pseudocaelatus]